MQFANANALSLCCFGFMSAILGGIISDKYSPKHPRTMANIGIICSLLVIPCNLMAFLTTGNFWLSICFLALKYLAGEAWGSPQLSMMQRAYPREKQGQMISSQLFFMTLCGTMGTATSGFLATYFNAAANPIIFGRILAGMTVFAELMSIPFFWLAGNAYVRHLKNEKRGE